jgi:hypothetical protein
MRRRRLFWLLLVRWGFAVLVAVAIAIGLLVALTVAPPPDVPAVALQAPIIYRVEVGAAVFLGLYLATMAFALALQNRGFTEIGTGGIRARELSEASQYAAAEQAEMELISELKDEVDDLRSWRERREYVR